MNAQAWSMWRQGFTPLSATDYGHMHALRYFFYWPIFTTGKLLGVAPDRVFTVVSALGSLVLICSITWSEASLHDRWGFLRSILYGVLILLVSLFMDGRLIFVLAGYALTIAAFLSSIDIGKWGWRHAAALLFGGFLCSLSSGTIAVAGALTLMALAFFAVRKDLQCRPQLLWTSLAFWGLFGQAIFVGIAINIEFYGGGIQGAIGLFDHGIGRIVLKVGPIGFVGLVIGAFAGIAVLWWLYHRLSPKLFLLTLAVVPAAAGSLVGFTAMALGFVPVLLLLRPALYRELLN